MALATQFAGFCLVFGAAWLWQTKTGQSLPLVLKLTVQGMVAAMLGFKLGLGPWWLPIQIGLPPAAALGLLVPFPPWVFLGLFLALLLVYWNSASERVPLYLTNPQTWAAMARLMPEREDFEFIDLGSGLGGPIAYLARQRKKARFSGVESAPIPFLMSWLRLRLSGPANVRLRFADFWKCNLADYDVVYCFLSTEPMDRLYAKVKAEMRPGSLFISNSFEVPQATADEVIEVDDRRKTKLHIWRM